MKTIPLNSSSPSDISAEAGKKGARRATGVPASAGSLDPVDPEVVEKKPRRRFTTAYKLRILQEYDGCTLPGEIGSLLRREGLYHSNISTWLRQREKGILHGLTPRKRGRKTKEVNPLAKEVARLEGENQRLANKLHRAETIIEVQKKISEILGIPQSNEGEKS